MTMPLFVEEPGVLELRGEVEVLEGDVSARLWVREWLHESAGEDSSGDAILTKVHVRKWVHSGQGERTVQVLCALPARTKVDLYFLVANTANPQASGAASFRDLRVLLR